MRAAAANATRGLAAGAALLALAVAAASLGAPALAAAGPGTGGQPPETPGGRGTGGLRDDSTGFAGTYVAGELPASAVILANFTLTSVPLVREVAVAGYVRASATSAEGTVTVRGAGAQLRIVDSLAAYLTIDFTENTSVQVAPAAGVSFAADPAGGLRLTAGAVTGLLWATCPSSPLELAGGSASLASATRGCALHFRADTSFDVLAGAEIAAAVASSSLAAEVSVTEVAGEFTPSVQRYAEIEVAVTVESGHIVIAVSATLSSGRSVLVILPRTALDAAISIDARYDGRAIAAAPTAADALNATDDGGAAEFYAASEGDLTALVVSVPAFSTHLAEFTGPAPAAAPGLTGVASGDLLAAVGIGLALTAAAGLALVRPRRRL
jgi:hypothetical protein